MKKYGKLLFISISIAITSQLYLNFVVDGFRVSTAVILFPVLLITDHKDININLAGLITGIMVFIVRIGIMMLRGSHFFTSFVTVYPASLFYIFYALIIAVSIRNKYFIDYSKIFFVILLSDFISNMLEVGIRIKFNYYLNDFNFYVILFFIAMTRATIAYAIILIIKQYKNLLTKEEHEKRYQNIVLLISDLKSEIYFMRKNIDNIEHVMSNAYTLYENLSTTDLNDNIKKLSLNITKDIHELKKDYIRVINGIELTFMDKLEVESMSLRDILYILKENTYRIIRDIKYKINLEFSFDVNFTTKKHYQLMSLLSNLVNNSIEAIEKSKKNGFIRISQGVNGDNYIFYVIDNGIGISKEDIDYIFNIGFSTKYNYETGDIYRGVGLTNVKYIVEEIFNGSIDVTSYINRGTTFKIIIPKNSIGE